MFKIFKTHKNDFIIYDVQSDKFFKNHIPEIAYNLSIEDRKSNSSITDYCSFKNLLSSFQIVLYEGHYYYNDLSSDSPTATDVRPPSIPAHWNSEQACYVEKLPFSETSKIKKFIKILFQNSIENLALHISDHKMGSICSNFIRHNQLRSLHEETPPLILDHNLCNVASERAEAMLNDAESFQHQDFNEFGENLYFSQQEEYLFDLNNPPPSGGTIAQAWYDEINEYDGTYTEQTGHYSQLVWTNTFFVGFGVATRDNRFYCVALYYPPGNECLNDEDDYLSKVNNLKSPEQLQKENSRTISVDENNNISEHLGTQLTDLSLGGENQSSSAADGFRRKASEVSIRKEISHNSSELIKSVIANQPLRVQTLYKNQAKVGYEVYGQTKRTISKFMSDWVNTKDEHGMTALHYAMKNGYIEIVETLLDFEADPSIGIKGNERNVFHIATQCKANNKRLIEIIFDKLEQQGIDPLELINNQDTSGFTPLFLAVSFNIPKESIELLLKNKANPNVAENKQGQTPFHYACENFIKISSRPTAKNFEENLNKSKELIVLLSNYSDVNLGDNDCWTPLASATKKGNLQLVKILLADCKCNANVKLRSGETPIILAAQIKKNEDLVRKLIVSLLEYGADRAISYSKHNIVADHWLKRHKYNIELKDL